MFFSGTLARFIAAHGVALLAGVSCIAACGSDGGSLAEHEARQSSAAIVVAPTATADAATDASPIIVARSPDGGARTTAFWDAGWIPITVTPGVQMPSSPFPFVSAPSGPADPLGPDGGVNYCVSIPDEIQICPPRAPHKFACYGLGASMLGGPCYTPGEQRAIGAGSARCCK
jgi:hypothetical protein